MHSAGRAIVALVRSLVLAAALLAAFSSAALAAEEHRSKAALDAFQHAHPCPSTGLDHPIRQKTGRLTKSGKPAYRTVRCPGWVVDHVDPICHGGPDAPSNMQWQTIADAKRKDGWERQLCRHARSR